MAKSGARIKSKEDVGRIAEHSSFRPAGSLRVTILTQGRREKVCAGDVRYWDHRSDLVSQFPFDQRASDMMRLRCGKMTVCYLSEYTLLVCTKLSRTFSKSRPGFIELCPRRQTIRLEVQVRENQPQIEIDHDVKNKICSLQKDHWTYFKLFWLQFL